MILSIFELDRRRKILNMFSKAGIVGKPNHVQYICTKCNSYFYLYQTEQALACCEG